MRYTLLSLVSTALVTSAMSQGTPEFYSGIVVSKEIHSGEIVVDMGLTHACGSTEFVSTDIQTVEQEITLALQDFFGIVTIEVSSCDGARAEIDSIFAGT